MLHNTFVKLFKGILLFYCVEQLKYKLFNGVDLIFLFKLFEL